MTLSRPFAWLGTCAVMLFIFSNIRTTELGVGYVVLGIAGACAIAVLALRRDPARTLVIRRSAVPLMLFMAYFLLRVTLDLTDPGDIKAFTVGTTGGLLFSFLLGVITSIFIGTGREPGRWKPRQMLPAFGLLLVFAAMALDSFLYHMATLRQDLFLVEGSDLAYQRAGSLTVMAAVVTSIHFSFIATARKKWGWLSGSIFLASLGVYLATIAVLMITAQLIGSNSGFVVTALLALATLAWIRRPQLSLLQWRRRLSMRRFNSFTALWKSMPRFVATGLMGLALMALVAIAALAYTKVDIHSFRIFGFSSGSVGGTSLTSRLVLLHRNFTTQLAVSPLFGNLRAEQLTTGEGTYAHSLASLLSHLGAIGASLFVVYVFAICRELKRGGAGLAAFYRDTEFGLLRILIIGVIIAFALIGTFFTWMPLWFSLGMLFPPVASRSAITASAPAPGMLST